MTGRITAPNITTMEHGTRSTYQKGCKCGSCRKANADYKTSLVSRNRESTESQVAAYREVTGSDALPHLQHGEVKTYTWQGCRCQECTDAARAAWRNNKAQRSIAEYARRLAELESNTSIQTERVAN